MHVVVSWNYNNDQSGYNHKTFDSAEEFVKWFGVNRINIIIWDCIYF